MSIRDFNRKLDKFLTAKIAFDKKARAMSPHVTYGVIAATPSTGATASISKKKSNKNFSMTLSFFNPRFDAPYPKDYAIKHEGIQQRNVMASPERMRSPKRDPIVQNNDEPVKDFKPSIRQTELSGKMTLHNEEPVTRLRSQGEFNHVYNARSTSPKITKRKTYVQISKEDLIEQSRTLRKQVTTAPKACRDAILEGDGDRIRPRKEKKHLRIDNSEHAQKINDRRAILPSDLGTSPKGKVFRDTTINLEHSMEMESPVKKVVGQRFSSPQPQREGIKGLMEYQHALPYRESAVTPKCTTMKFSDILASATK